MRRQTPWSSLPALLAVVLGACEDTDPNAPTAREIPPIRATLIDAAHDGPSGFYFLPPMAADPEATGSFDATLLPYLLIGVCELSETGCSETAVFTAEGEGAARIRMDERDEHYIVNWNTAGAGLRVGSVHRIIAVVANAPLGIADVELVANARDLQDVAPGNIGLVNGRTLPIKIRIEEGAVTVLGAGGGTITALEGRVRLDIPQGALAEPTGITIDVADGLPEGPGDPEGPAFAMGPADLEFLSPVLLTIQGTPAEIPADPQEEVTPVLHTLDDDGWQELASDYDFQTGVIVLELLGLEPDPAPEEPIDDTPADLVQTGDFAFLVFDFQGFFQSLISSLRNQYRLFPIPTFTRACTISSIRLDPRRADVLVGQGVQFDLTITGQSGHRGSRLYDVEETAATWSSNRPSIASVDRAGFARGEGAGVAHVSALYPKFRRYCRSRTVRAPVTVTPVIDRIEISPATSTLEPDETVQLNATAFDADGATLSGISFTWSSSDEAVATVDGGGLVTAHGEGTAGIFAAASGAFASATVTVGAQEGIVVGGFDQTRSWASSATQNFSFTTGSVHALARDLLDDVFPDIVFDAGTDGITPDYLAGIDILVKNLSASSLTGGEVCAIETFVANGGAFLEVSGIGDGRVLFGTTHGSFVQNGRATVLAPSSPLINGPFGNAGSSLNVGFHDNFGATGGATVIAWDGIAPNILQIEPNANRAGRAVLIADEEILAGAYSVPNTGFPWLANSAANRTFLKNVFAWLSDAPGAPADVDYSACGF